jgi:pyruvate/2-oxoglutarate dehydrogenase complex dihydrolipoamide dehydrogenase (E3) component
MTQVRAYLRSTIQQIYEPTKPEALHKKGMDVLLGATRFLDPHTLEVGTQRIQAKKILINTGAEPHVPAIDGLADVPYFTYQKIFENDRLPKRMLAVGGGPIGCEIAQAYRRLGSEVTLIAERLLPSEEPEVSELLNRTFAQEGIERIASRPSRCIAKVAQSPCKPQLVARQGIFCWLQPDAHRSFMALVWKRQTCATQSAASR